MSRSLPHFLLSLFYVCMCAPIQTDWRNLKLAVERQKFARIKSNFSWWTPIWWHCLWHRNAQKQEFETNCVCLCVCVFHSRSRHRSDLYFSISMSFTALALASASLWRRNEKIVNEMATFFSSSMHALYFCLYVCYSCWVIQVMNQKFCRVRFLFAAFIVVRWERERKGRERERKGEIHMPSNIWNKTRKIKNS